MFSHFIFIFFTFCFCMSSIAIAIAGDTLQVARELVEANFPLTATAFLSTALKEGRTGPAAETVIEKIISKSGSVQLENLKLEGLNLENSRNPAIKYLLSKKYFKKGEYARVLDLLNHNYPSNYPLAPFAFSLRASALNLLNRSQESITYYERCIDSAESVGHNGNDFFKKQLSLIKDTCIVGIARSYFATKDFKKAESQYLDLSKSSIIWPEILFEEAWTSFYLKNYNRTLGKLVTYNAPILDFYFNPEADVLRALAYLRLCLWNDAKKNVDEFYSQYEQQTEDLEKILNGLGKDDYSYATLSLDKSKWNVYRNPLFERLMMSIVHDFTFQEIQHTYDSIGAEIGRLHHSRFRDIGQKGAAKTLDFQKRLLGNFVKHRLFDFRRMMIAAFEGMSYIKLEVLDKKKDLLYSNEINSNRARGNIQYLKRNEKQYFWTFNGEFWADELGDYVFALKSECAE